MQQLVRVSERFVYLPPYQETDRPVLAAISGDKYTLIIDAGNSADHGPFISGSLRMARAGLQ